MNSLVTMDKACTLSYSQFSSMLNTDTKLKQFISQMIVFIRPPRKPAQPLSGLDLKMPTSRANEMIHYWRFLWKKSWGCLKSSLPLFGVSSCPPVKEWTQMSIPNYSKDEHRTQAELTGLSLMSLVPSAGKSSRFKKPLQSQKRG